MINSISKIQNHKIDIEKLDGLNIIERILLRTDGSITILLEELLQEKLIANKIYEDFIESKRNIKEMGISKGDKYCQRTITLQGKTTGKNYLYASSIINKKKLNKQFYSTLINTEIPIGKVWDMFRFETYKTVIDWGEEPAKNLGQFFKIQKNSPLLYRTYCVYSQGNPVMMITEKFPKNIF
jgi:chorismate-pyruvate lyase